MLQVLAHLASLSPPPATLWIPDTPALFPKNSPMSHGHELFSLPRGINPFRPGSNWLRWQSDVGSHQVFLVRREFCEECPRDVTHPSAVLTSGLGKESKELEGDETCCTLSRTDSVSGWCWCPVAS